MLKVLRTTRILTSKRLSVRFFSEKSTSTSPAPASSSSSSSTDSSSSSDSSSSDRIHSTDIAFKPNNDGWGGTKKYSKNHERIFGKKKQKSESTKESSGGVTKITFKTTQ
tara:strand:+ start:161 stop:490 length:330 start_codon:yes stop_codon:yes gene_type:complete